MITLAFDSTAKIASVAVADGEKTLALYSIDNGLTQSELLLPMAEDPTVRSMEAPMARRQSRVARMSSDHSRLSILLV